MRALRLSLSGGMVVVGLILLVCGPGLSASASPAPTGGSNVGFRYAGVHTPGRSSTDGVFLRSDGVGLDLCGTPVGCDLDFTYKVDGVTDQEATVTGPSSYDTWPAISPANVNDPFCWQGIIGSAPEHPQGPLTNFNCFNQNGFGQEFVPTVSGKLSGFSIAMACMSTTGSTDITANLYEVAVSGSGHNLSGAPIATATFTLAGCPTSWSGHAFSDADFTYPVMDFGVVDVSPSVAYAVLFSGDAIAGHPPIGAGTPVPPAVSPPTPPAPHLASTGAGATEGNFALAIGLLGLGAIGLTIRNRSASRPAKDIIESHGL